MKRNIFILYIFFIVAKIFSWEFVNLPQEYSRYYDDFANKNILAHNAEKLQKKHNINVCIFKYRGKVRKDIDEIANRYFEKLTQKNNVRQLFIFITTKREKNVILLTEDLQNEINEEYIKILQDDVLRSLMGRWYISEARVLGKILGSIIYLLEKNTLTVEQINELKSEMIIVDDFLYQLSRKPVISDLIDLFEFEPISFFFYFPFIFYFLFVKVIGTKFKEIGFIISNIMWFVFVLFIFFLIFHRIDIFVHEYVQFFYMFLGLNIPLYLYLINLYGNEIETTAYNYLYNVTGGFDLKNIFEGKEWEKR